MARRSSRSQRRTMHGVTVVSSAAGWCTVDGRFLLVEDESSGSTAWRLLDRRRDEVLVSGLRAGCRVIAARVAGEASADVSTASAGGSTAPLPSAGAVDGSAGALDRGPAGAGPGGCSAVSVPADPSGGAR